MKQQIMQEALDLVREGWLRVQAAKAERDQAGRINYGYYVARQKKVDAARRDLETIMKEVFEDDERKIFAPR